MRFKIEHEIRGRVRLHICQKRMTCRQADQLEYFLTKLNGVISVKVVERNQDVVICYSDNREEMLRAIQRFSYEKAEAPESYLQNSGREMNGEYWEKMVNHVVLHYGKKILLPLPVRTFLTTLKSVKYIWKGVRTLAKCRIEVPVLDATAIGVSMLRGDFSTASSVMFLLGFGEILEDWTHKKSVDDLARSMSLNVSKVWLITEDSEVQVGTDEIKPGDRVRIHMGTVIPFDGIVTEGEAMVNEASLTGESMPVAKHESSYVYAGTVMEEGELTIRVKETSGSTKFEKIVTMIEETEKLKSAVESKAEHLADRLVPYTLAGTALTYALTRNVTKALSILMVDFSCALKLAMPISVLAAIREANAHHITVKGGKFLEAVAEADTIVFDKTGTLTKAQPTVVDVVSFNGDSKENLLRLAACMEEHFPHSMAKAVMDAAKERGLTHEEMHSKVEYIVAHGISTMVDGRKAIIGSHHFVFEDEKCTIPVGKEELFRNLPEEYSHLYLGIEGKLAAVICIEDPLRPEAPEVVKALRKAGFTQIVMMTGDSDRTAKAIAARVGVDKYYSEVLPEDKAKFVEEAKAQGRKVLMVGDGINDSPALSAADVGIAISDGAELAREIADITIGADDLSVMVTLKEISNGLMDKIHKNYRRIVGINGSLIALGVTGVIQPTMSALLHNTSTLLIGMDSMKSVL
ncbi:MULTISPECIES: heavy metal translocating P-type ATPase [Blautia]|uniref:heavy metal translocating P-type ATPase n=1 Tax=Blautia TaxID=572511 RepID=UPI001D06E164|nr:MULTISPECIES: heavy metal translocating P-type ATPase [Blautia]MCB6730347.1 heavy metal translocating P-type ATPase [Blautia obeum]MCB6741154.1 heavy metal translocating P-type ATPase [Blautia sp. 210820-DFI.6.14]MCB6957669.1 heavy metal translocating P-type ATPase [Blautia obeum]MCG4674895.1 heavy metal translocating P-type ATPase [Blautia obeum]MDE8680858.1 heavy metal translocating P-type ATPase [Blautia schinkii]